MNLPGGATTAARATAARATGAPPEDLALAARLRQGDGDAFAELVRTQGGRMLAVARRFLHNDPDAQDTVQDAFLSAFRAIGRWDGRARLSTWLHRIVVNAALMKIRSRKRAQEESIEELLPHFAEDGHHAQEPLKWEDSAHELLERKERAALVRGCIDDLPETYRTVLLLRDIEELDTAEAAQALGVTENAVKIRLHRARQALRTLLDPHFRRGAA